MNRPHLSKKNIEDKVDKVLTHFDSNYFCFKRKTPLLRFAHFLSTEHKIEFNYEKELGFSNAGNKILGHFCPKPMSIYIDNILVADRHRFNFVLAHEIGHLVLHRKLDTKFIYEVESTEKILYETITGKRILKTDKDFIEWQASFFAAAFLMPKTMIVNELISIQKNLGISRVGSIFLDNQLCNIRDYYTIVEQLSLYFEVSKNCVMNRLEDLQLIEKRFNPVHVSNPLSYTLYQMEKVSQK